VVGEVVGGGERVVFWRMRDGGRVSGKREKRENGGFWVAGGEWDGRRKAGGGVLVVGEVVGGGGWWWVGWVWIVGRRRTEEGLGVGCTAGGEMRRRRKKSDLKAGLDGPKTEYVRTYIGTFDRTRAGEWVPCSGMRSNLCKHVRTHACGARGESRRYGRTSPRQSRTQRSARSNLHEYVRTCSEFFFFFFLNIQNKITKHKTQNTHIYKNRK
jgi:hypothetical protein